jgi:predicted regulator of Ras-like GTPase activity (Roadblock/LC7/MglB family)
MNHNNFTLHFVATINDKMTGDVAAAVDGLWTVGTLLDNWDDEYAAIKSFVLRLAERSSEDYRVCITTLTSLPTHPGAGERR